MEKLLLGQSFPENVSFLFGRLYVPGNNAFLLTNMGSKEMVFEYQVLVARGHLGHVEETHDNCSSQTTWNRKGRVQLSSKAKQQVTTSKRYFLSSNNVVGEIDANWQ